MKRQLSLVLALVMILGTFTTVFAADTSTDAITEASTFLKDKGVLVGNMNGDLMLGEKLSRQDTAILVSRLMGEYDVAKDFPTAENIPTYEDIKDNFYLPVLAWAQANKTFVGHSAARFGFDDNVTAQEYSKVLLVALGYEVGPETNLDLTWEATLQKAKDLGILKNINDDIKNTDEITRGEMAVMTFNALSVMMKDGTKTLAEKLNIVMPAASKLTAEVKDTMNLKEVVINLSNAKLADSDRLMDASNYKVKGVSVDKVELVGNDVIVTLEKALVKDRTYELTVRNVETGVNGTYNFKALDNTQPTVEKVTVLGEYGIKVTTSEPIKDAKERNFLVDGKNVSMNVENYGRDLILTPYYNEQFSDKADTLTIKELEDYSGYKSVERDFDIKIVKDDVAPKVTDVISKGNIIEVTFDKDIYKKSVKEYDGRSNVGNISYQSGRQTVYADTAKKVDTNKVEYTFDQEMPRRTDVTIEGVQNHSKVAMVRVTESPRLVVDNIEPEIIEKNVTTTNSTAKIELKFNKAVEGSFIDNVKEDFVVKDHFTLYEREAYRGREVTDAGVKITARYKDTTKDSKKDVIVVDIVGLEKYNKKDDNNYVLEVENFADVNSSRNIMYRDYVDFKVQEDDDFEVESVDVYESRTNAEITINFSNSLDRVFAEELSNYLFNDGSVKDVKDLKGSVTLGNDGKSVTIVLPEDKFRVEKFKTLTISNAIKDLDGNRFNDSAVYYFDSKVLLKSGEKIADVLAATEAVEKAEATPTQANVDAAQPLVTGLDNGDIKKDLQKRLDKVKSVIDAEAATEAVEKAETTPTQANVDAAQPLVTGLDNGDVKTDLQKRLNDVKALIASQEVEEAKIAVAVAEAAKTQANVDAAQTALDKLEAGDVKTGLQTRLDAVKDNVIVEKVKTDIQALTLTPVANATLNTEADAKSYVEDLIDTVDLNGATYEIVEEDFTAAVASTSDGSYKFKVKITLNDAEATTVERDLEITK